ncbi:Ubiquitin carboxyl-terminal hydrolase isozyme L3 [Spiromyces aspiralis]|uniref:Ubiquitin carboxyl-terminal hydrolase isozyme L3 n=1 Tax=Spiromyces aspiralis TaxID=68401 RepID=A0ACC1HTG9_9FUNG|nr:Ubiquitin carboxyl-terminal hydrolase isozyme L3 [Spiromyces aspiralis]
MSSKVAWTPLESNPEVMTKMVRNLGVVGIKGQDDSARPLGLDDELLAFVPQPVLSVIFLYPLEAKLETYREKLLQEHRPPADESKKVWHTKQTISNACGTIAVLHSLANNAARLEFEADSALKAYLDKTWEASPEERDQLLKVNEEIANAHKTSAQGGQTTAPNPTDDVYLHFVSFVMVDGKLWELDGRLSGPACHGPCDDLLKGTAKVVTSYIEAMKNNASEEGQEETSTNGVKLDKSAELQFSMIYVGKAADF